MRTSRSGRRAVLVLVAGTAAAPGARRTEVEAAPLAPEEQVRTGGSAVPCAAPLAWRVARVDEGFGITDEGAIRMLEEATHGWRFPGGSPLFVHDPSQGFPVRFVHDERQERVVEHRRRSEELDVERARLAERRTTLLAWADDHAAATTRHNERQSDFQSRVAEHNAAVLLWAGRGGAPADIAAKLDATTVALEVERNEIAAVRAELERGRRAFGDEESRLNADVEEHRRRAIAVDAALPGGAEESGEYREAVRMEGGRVVSVSREVRIYRFSSLEELRLVAAHELGHALGLVHIQGRSAVMNAQHDARVVPTAPTEADLELLARTCPALVPDLP